MKIEVSTGAQVSAQLFRQLLLAFDPMAITRGRELHHASVSQRGARIKREHLPQLVELQNALAAMLDWAGRAHADVEYGTGATSHQRLSGR